MRTALITGGAGFVGSHLAERLVSNGYNVTVLDDLTTGSVKNLENILNNKNLKLYIGRAQDEDLLNRLVSESDHVYHLASSVGVKMIMDEPIRTIHNIIDSTASVLKFASRYRKKVLITSTSEVYGKSKDIPFNEGGDRIEGATTIHRWAYASAKALDEFLALAYFKTQALPVTVVRLFNTVGPRQLSQYGMVIPKMVRSAIDHGVISVHGDGKQSRCFCHVADVVQALQLLMESDRANGEVVNVGSREEICILDLANLIKEKTGGTATVRFVSYEEVFPGGGFEDMNRRVPDISKVSRLVGWEPKHTLNEIITDVIGQRSP
ncbi:MAG: NAD-dependent epimerase/dehydratase family protein [Gammaproteobacteria bacterium]|nr:NAD-dependent epimerase/dehydratase family protein [Gammaproteobacteria bacterium]